MGPMMKRDGRAPRRWAADVGDGEAADLTSALEVAIRPASPRVRISSRHPRLGLPWSPTRDATR
jgi:hypothetical protein